MPLSMAQLLALKEAGLDGVSRSSAAKCLDTAAPVRGRKARNFGVTYNTPEPPRFYTPSGPKPTLYEEPRKATRQDLQLLVAYHRAKKAR